jgi:hypothetical protein
LKNARLQGKVMDVNKGEETRVDNEGNRWRKCIFTIRLTNFSKFTKREVMPERLKGKEVKIIRYCCFDWHYKLDARKTLDVEETAAVLSGKPTISVYW